MTRHECSALITLSHDRPMTRTRLICTALFVLFAGCSAAAMSAQQPPDERDAGEGHRLAVKICDARHVAASDQQFLPILRPPAPTFQVIADRPGTIAALLRNFLLTTHATITNTGNMPNLQLTDDQVGVLVAYILSLRKRH